MKRIAITIVLTSAMVLGAYAISQAASSPGRQASQTSTSLSDTAVPSSTAEELTEPGTAISEYGIEPERATYSAAARTWVIPGRSGMCLVALTPDGNFTDTSCHSLADADSGGLVMIRRSASGPVIYGYAPSGASVTITNEDGSSVSPPVTNDVFMYADSTASSVAVHVGSGEKTTPIYQAN